MTKQMARRKFLSGAACTALAFSNLKALSQTSPINESAMAEVEPGKMPRLFSGCCAYSFAGDLRSGKMTLEDFIHKAVQLRLDAVDITTYYLKSVDPAYLESLRHLAYRNAVVFSGVACGVSMVKADPAKRAGSLNEIKQWVDVTDRLGASHLRVFAGQLPSGTTVQQAVNWVVETMKAASDYSGQKGIMLGLEDHSGVSQSADVCLEIMQRVNSPYAGINLDITHFVPTPAQDAYAQIAACIPYATNTHIRDLFDDHTPIDLDRVWRLFAQAGFKGYMSAEYDSNFAGDKDTGTGIPKLIAKIRTLCKKYSTV